MPKMGMSSTKIVSTAQKVRTHSGVRGNEIADSLTVDAARSDTD